MKFITIAAATFTSLLIFVIGAKLWDQREDLVRQLREENDAMIEAINNLENSNRAIKEELAEINRILTSERLFKPNASQER